MDTWHAGGLRGTGSHDVVVDDVFVPGERTFALDDPDHIDRPLYRMPFAPAMGVWCAAICLGVAQTATDTLLELGSSKKPVDPGPGLRDRPVVQAMVASSAAALEAARLLLRHTLADLWSACSRGTPITDMQRARMWGSLIHAARTAKTVVTSMYEAAGRPPCISTVPSSGLTATSTPSCNTLSCSLCGLRKPDGEARTQTDAPALLKNRQPQRRHGGLFV